MYKGIDGPSTKLTHEKLLKKKCLVKIYRTNNLLNCQVKIKYIVKLEKSSSDFKCNKTNIQEEIILNCRTKLLVNK